MSFVPGHPKGVALLALVTAALAGMALPVATQDARGRRYSTFDGHAVVEGEVLVKYRDDRASVRHAQIEARADADAVESFTRSGVKRIRSRRLRTADLVDTLRRDPDVEYAEPNYVLYAAAPPNDPSFGSLWALLNTGVNPIGGGGVAGADINATTAWTMSTGSRANVVGVIDSGVDYTHPDLAANMWSAPSTFQVTIGGQTITCQAGTHGFNAITRTCDPMDDNSHGTHVAGTIGAVGNNGTGVVGVNWVASMMALKFLGASGSGATSDAIAAIEFAIQAKTVFGTNANIRVLSNSWGGGGYSSSLLSAINAANNADMLFVAAAGNNHSNNDAQPAYPASYSAANVIAVASSTSSDQLSSFSNYGVNSVHLAAPGSAILSTTPGNHYSSFNGTSMATPQVSGVAMLALSACTLTTAELKALILDNVDEVDAFMTVTRTGGRLNAAKTLDGCEYPRVTSLAITPNRVAPQPPGTTVTWTAAAGGGEAPHQYQWAVFDGSSWTTVTDWSADNTFEWSPLAQNAAYQIAGRARSAWNSGARELATTAAFPIMPVVTSLSLTPSVASPQAVGTAVTWTAAAGGGEPPYQYQWALTDGTTWTTLTNWASSNTFTWTPSSANAAYQMAVRARGSWNTGPREKVTIESYAIKPKATSLTMSANKVSPQAPNTTITWTAVAGGGEAPYQYQWAVYDGSAWTTVRDWDASNTFEWTPSVAGSLYQVAARVRGAWNTGPRELATTQAFVVQPVVTNLTLTPSLAAPQPIGAAVTWTAVASGGQAPYQYQWAVYDGTTWTTVVDWTTNATFVWTPTAVNNGYQVAVRARSAWNSGTREMATVQAYAIKPKVTSLTLTPGLSAPQAVGTAVTWTASASGGEAPYQYQWAVYDGSAWTTVVDWTSSASFEWAPGTANSAYQVAVRVRGSWNAGPREMASVQAFAIMPKVTNLTLTPSVAAPQAVGASVVLTAAASGGLPPYQYQWAVFDGTAWTTVSDWSAGTTYVWTPGAANSAYQLAVRARSAWNSGPREMATVQAYAIKPKVTSLSLTPDVGSPQPAGATITFTAVAGGGEAPYQYQWAVYDGTAWTTVKDWSADPTFAWTPSGANASYQIAVRARGSWNTGPREMATTRAFVIQ